MEFGCEIISWQVDGVEWREMWRVMNVLWQDSSPSEDVEDDPEVVMVRLGPNDRRFGFSVVGGSEEGFPPRIDEIASGNWIGCLAVPSILHSFFLLVTPSCCVN